MAYMEYWPKCRPRVSHKRLTGVAITTSHAECLLIHVANAEPFNKTRDEIIDKTLDEYTATMATVKLWSNQNNSVGEFYEIPTPQEL